MENFTQTLSTIFKGAIFRVPDYQRGYSWDEKQLQDLVDDIELVETENKSSHYTGTIVLDLLEDVDDVLDDEGNIYRTYDVVDGQQRLTTMSILLNEIAMKLLSLDEASKSFAAGIKKNFLFIKVDNQVLSKLTLNSDTNDFYIKNIISEKPNVFTPKIFSESNLQDAKEFFISFLKERRHSFESDAAYAVWLKNDLYKKVVNYLQFNVYIVPEATDVGIIFETMNNRGKKLSEMEKVKNYLLYVASKLKSCGGTELAKQINLTWKVILEKLMSSNLTQWYEDNLLRSSFLMAYNYRPSEWKNYDSIKKTFSLKDYKDQKEELRDAIYKYIDTLKNCSVAYADIQKPSDKSFQNISDSKLRKQIIEYSGKLERMTATASFIPILMAARLQNAHPETYLEILKLCELYAFRVYRMMGRRANAGQSNLFKTGYDLYKSEITADSVKNNIHSLLTYYCNNSDYENSVDERENWYDWYGLKYLLYEYELHLADRAHLHLDWNTFQKKDKKDTIEHILPQTPDKPYWKRHWKKADINEVLHDIGNLVVTLDNSSYSNKGFDEKKGCVGNSEPCYANSALFAEKELCAFDVWDFNAYEERRAKLSLWMKERWGTEDYIKAITVIEDDEITETF